MPVKGSIPVMGESGWENMPPPAPGQIVRWTEQGWEPVNLPSAGQGVDHTLPGDPSSVRLTDGVTFYKTTTPADTQPVSGTVNVGNLPATQPVTGTFWQATQPVSGPLTDTQLRATAVPVSGTVTASGPLTDTQLRATPVPVSGTFYPATQPVSGTVTAPTLTKGTQGATGFSTQDLKDAGRASKVFSATNFSTATSEGMVTLTPITDGAAGSTGTSFAVTAGKRLRLTGMTLSTRNAGAAIQGPMVKLRISSSGAVTTSSPLVATLACQTPAATTAHVASQSITFPEGIELSGTMQVGISQLGIGAVAGNDVSLIGYEF